ncbi:MAG: SdpI family protein [Clostridia bacterium]|nr:SdpI family protein [Clostridia bacterium]
MIKENKWKVILSSIVIILPSLVGLALWKRLPDSMLTHWGADGNADGFSAKSVAIILLPAILLGLHLLCLFFTSLDKKQRGQNKKALGIIFWIVPFISLFANGVMYSAALGRDFDFQFFMPVLLGLLFVFIGNYLPKIKQNRTLGIKISWALNNAENWNKTHRFGGKLWVAGGLVMLLSTFLPINLMVTVVVAIVLAMVIIPVIYSYNIYRKHQKEGIIYSAAPRSRAESIAVKISAVVVLLILVGIAVVMFTGEIRTQYNDKGFEIKATYYSDLKVDYAAVYNIEYRETCDAGIRTNGFGSARLSMGTFRNDEFGTYTRYAYTGCDACIVLEVDQKILVISGKNKEATKQIYDLLSSKIS